MVIYALNSTQTICYIPYSIGYINELMNETVRVCEHGNVLPLEQLPQPHSLSSCYDKPDKISAIERHRTRFSTQ